MDVVVVREGKNLKGRVLGLVVGTVGKRVLGKALGKDRQGHRGPQRRGEGGGGLLDRASRP